MRISDWSSDVCSSDLLDGWFLDASGHLAGCFNYQQFLVDECTRNLEIEPRSALAKIPKSRSFVIAIQKLSWLREECQQAQHHGSQDQYCQNQESPHLHQCSPMRCPLAPTIAHPPDPAGTRPTFLTPGATLHEVVER